MVPTSRSVGAALRHDFGDAEAVADFDELAARDEDFAVARERGEDEQNGGGAIVDDDGGFGAGEALEQLRGVNVALAARAGFEVVFEIGILRRGAAEFFDGGFGERGASEIGVENDAGGIDHRLERLREDLLDGVGDFVLEGGGIERKDDRAAAVNVCVGGIGFGGEAGAKSVSAARVISRSSSRSMRAASAARRGWRRSSSTEGIWRSRSDLGVEATRVFQHIWEIRHGYAAQAPLRFGQVMQGYSISAPELARA